MDCGGSSVFQKKHRLGGLRLWAPRSSAFLLAGPWVKHFETSQWTLIQLWPVRNNQPQECGTGLFSSAPVILKSLQMYVLQEGHACFLTDVLNLFLLFIRGIRSKAIICSNAQFQQVQQGLAICRGQALFKKSNQWKVKVSPQHGKPMEILCGPLFHLGILKFSRTFHTKASSMFSSWAATLSFPGFLLLFGLAQIVTQGFAWIPSTGWPLVWWFPCPCPQAQHLWRQLETAYDAMLCGWGHGEIGGSSFSFSLKKLARWNPLKCLYDPLWSHMWSQKISKFMEVRRRKWCLLISSSDFQGQVNPGFRLDSRAPKYPEDSWMWPKEIFFFLLKC